MDGEAGAGSGASARIRCATSDRQAYPLSSVLMAPLLPHRSCSQLHEMVGKRRLDGTRRIAPEDTVYIVADVGGHRALGLVRCEQAPSRDRTVEHRGPRDEARRR